MERKQKGKKLTLTFPESNEGVMLVHKGELVTGILDKAMFGKFGLVHAVQVCEELSVHFYTTTQYSSSRS